MQVVETKGTLWHMQDTSGSKARRATERSRTFMVVATTRPETMLADTAVAVHPQNERLQATSSVAT